MRLSVDHPTANDYPKSFEVILDALPLISRALALRSAIANGSLSEGVSRTALLLAYNY